MVRISANGDILPDAPKPTIRMNSNQAQRPNQGHIQHGGDEGQGMGNQAASLFDNVNNRLLEAGVPRWNAGPYVVEPIVSLGFVLAGFLIGWHGLLFAAILFFLAKYSASQGPNPFSAPSTQGPAQGRPGGRRPGGGGGGPGGKRLGRL